MAAWCAGVRNRSIGVAVVGLGDCGCGVYTEPRIWVIVFVCYSKKGQVEAKQKPKEETRKQNMVRELFFFPEALIHTLCFLLEVFRGWVKVALEHTVKGASVVACQGATLLEDFHGTRQVDLGPAGGRRELFNDLDAVLKRGVQSR